MVTRCVRAGRYAVAAFQHACSQAASSGARISPPTRPSRTTCTVAQPTSPPRTLAWRVSRSNVKIHCSPYRFSKYPK
jgi:hypothetical protein